MKIFLLINAILEIVAGIIMFLAPKALPGNKEASAQTTTWISMYGAAALGIGFFAFLAWRNYPNAELTYTFILTFLLFHTGVMAAAARGYRAGLKDMMPVAILHGVFAIATLYFYVQMR